LFDARFGPRGRSFSLRLRLFATSIVDFYLLYTNVINIRDTSRFIKHDSHVVCVAAGDLILKKFPNICSLSAVMSYSVVVYTVIVIVLAI